MQEFLQYKIAELGSVSISVYNLFMAVILLLATWLLLFFTKRLIYRVDKFDEGKKYALYRLSKYIMLVISIVLVLKVFGVDVTVFVAGSAALLVGLGLGVQSLFNDFISGIEILLEGTIEVNDIVEIDGIVAKVREIGLRTSYVETSDGIYIFVPNSILTSHKLINYTHEKAESRFHVSVGVSYNSDIELCKKIMIKCAEQNPLTIKEPHPYVRLKEFGDSSVILDVLFWSKEIFIIDDIKSEIRQEIFREFGKHNIEIPFPQRTLHFDKSTVLNTEGSGLK